jgi:hypothetical protein
LRGDAGCDERGSSCHLGWRGDGRVGRRVDGDRRRAAGLLTRGRRHRDRQRRARSRGGAERDRRRAQTGDDTAATADRPRVARSGLSGDARRQPGRAARRLRRRERDVRVRWSGHACASRKLVSVIARVRAHAARRSTGASPVGDGAVHIGRCDAGPSAVAVVADRAGVAVVAGRIDRGNVAKPLRLIAGAFRRVARVAMRLRSCAGPDRSREAE